MLLLQTDIFVKDVCFKKRLKLYAFKNCTKLNLKIILYPFFTSQWFNLFKVKYLLSLF